MPKVNGKWEIDSGLSPLGKYRIPKDKNFSGEHRPFNKASVKSCEALEGNFAKAVSSAIDDWKRSGGSDVSLGKRGWISRKDAGKEARNNNRKVYLNNIRLFGWGLAAEVDSVPTVSAGSQADALSVTANDVRGQLDACLVAYGLALFYDQESSSADDKGMFICPLHIAYDADISELDYDADYYSESSADLTGSISDVQKQASVASYAYYFSNQFEQIQGQAESFKLRGNRALANDEPLFNTIKTAVESSLRSFASGPNGEFVAWFPDYWGLYGAPTLILSDMELRDLTIEKDGEKFYSHVYMSGVTTAGTSVGFDSTQGVVSIESNIDAASSSAYATDDDDDDVFEVSDKPSFILKALLGIDDTSPDAWKYTPKELYRRYGARPSKNTCGSLVESGNNSDITYESNPEYILPFLNALYKFMRLWSEQVSCKLTITYMPSLRPGMRIRLESFDIEMYVESVSHSMSYQTGFTTSVTCVCPKGSLVSGMINPDFDSLLSDSSGVDLGGAKSVASDAQKGVAVAAWRAANSRAQSIADEFFGVDESVAASEDSAWWTHWDGGHPWAGGSGVGSVGAQTR